MFRSLQLSTAWLIVAVVLAGHLPALLHRSGCQHSCGVTPRICEPDAADHKDRHCCESRSHESASALGSSHSVVPVVGSFHDCADCVICQSLASVNGFGWQSSEVVHVSRLCESISSVGHESPGLEGFGFFQSRAPPALKA
jgi:hypothetical protein